MGCMSFVIVGVGGVVVDVVVVGFDPNHSPLDTKPLATTPQ